MRYRSGAIALMVALSTFIVYPVFAQSDSAEALLRKAEQSIYPDAFIMKTKLQTLKSGSVESTMEMTITYKRGVGSRIELLSPPRSHGIRFLQKDSNLWMFNPQAGTSRAIRLSNGASFQGSVFSNGDLANPQYSKQYAVRIAGTETIVQPTMGTVKAIVIEGIARNERAPYSKIKLWVRATDDLLLRAEFYAKSGLLFRTMVCSDVREIAGAQRPTVLTMKSMDQKNRESIMTIEALQSNPSLSDSVFTLSALTR